MNSMPARSAICASARQSGQLPDHRSGTIVTARPEEQLAPNRPNLSRFALPICARSRCDVTRSIPVSLSLSGRALPNPAGLPSPACGATVECRRFPGSPNSRKIVMSDWLHALPVLLMALVVFGLTYLVAAAIYAAVVSLAARGYARSFKAVSPGMLPPLGIVFGLFAAFTAAQIWNDNERAEAAVNREAGALRTAIVLSSEFAAEPGDRLRHLIRQHIRETVDEEWPLMVHQSATLKFTPHFLPDALQLTLGLTPDSDGQRVAQR